MPTTGMRRMIWKILQEMKRKPETAMAIGEGGWVWLLVKVLWIRRLPGPVVIEVFKVSSRFSQVEFQVSGWNEVCSATRVKMQ